MADKRQRQINILAIDTSSAFASIALLTRNEVHELHAHAPMQQAKLILKMIADVLKQAKVALGQVDALAYGCGPGSFTGVRMAATTAQGIAYGLSIPVIPISSLASLAQTAANEHDYRDIFVSVDARMDKVYYAHYRVSEGGDLLLVGDEKHCRPEEVGCEGSPFGVGNGWKLYQNRFKSVPREVKECEVRASAVLTLARRKIEQYDYLSAKDALVNY